MYCSCVNVYCTVLLPPGDNPIAANKCIIPLSYTTQYTLYIMLLPYTTTYTLPTVYLLLFSASGPCCLQVTVYFMHSVNIQIRVFFLFHRTSDGMCEM